MSVLGKRVAAEQNDKPSGVGWECPVCFSELGVTAGCVPCVLTSCGVVGHMICYECGQKLQTCPLCRKQIVGLLPLPQLVDEQQDAAASAILARVQGRMDPALTSLSRAMLDIKSKVGELPDMRAEAIQQRLAFLTGKVQENLENGVMEKHGGRSFDFWNNIVPEFDLRRVRLQCKPGNGFRRGTRAEIKANLERITRELQPFLDEIYKDSAYTVRLCSEQTKGQRFVYLRTNVRRRN